MKNVYVSESKDRPILFSERKYIGYLHAVAKMVDRFKPLYHSISKEHSFPHYSISPECKAKLLRKTPILTEDGVVDIVLMRDNEVEAFGNSYGEKQRHASYRQFNEKKIVSHVVSPNELTDDDVEFISKVIDLLQESHKTNQEVKEFIRRKT